MDSLFGLVGDGYTIVAADAAAPRSILVFKQDEDKIIPLDSTQESTSTIMMGCAGPQGDRTQFCEYIQKNIILSNLRTGLKMSTHAAAYFTRRELATALRSRGSYQVNLLLAGCDQDGPSLYHMDYFATLQKTNFGVHGYGSNFTLSIFDKEWKEGMSLAEGMEIIRKCIVELKMRFLIHQPKFIVKVVDKTGIHTHIMTTEGVTTTEAPSTNAEEDDNATQVIDSK